MLGGYGVRFYSEEVDKLTESINDVVREYEAKSAKCCEYCGEQSDDVMLRKKPPVFRWVATLCTNCMEERIALYNGKMEESIQKKIEDFIE